MRLKPHDKKFKKFENFLLTNFKKNDIINYKLKKRRKTNMKKSCMNSTYSVTIKTLIGKDKMSEIHKSVTKKSKRK